MLFHSLTLLGHSLPNFLTIFLAHGYLAVDLFFVLSGFVIYLSYHAGLTNSTASNVSKFYWNRLARIYPVHFVMLIGYLFLYLAFQLYSDSGTAPESYTWSAFFQSLFLIHMWVGTELTWNVPSWSISSEWFVYLFFPLMAVSLRKIRNSPSVSLLAIAAVAALLGTLYKWMDVASLGSEIPRMALIRTMLEFLMGVFIGSLFVNHRSTLEKYRSVGLGGFLVLVALYISLDLPDYTVIPISFALLIAYLSVSTDWLAALLSRPSLVYLGEISYSTYMVHYLVYDLLKAMFMSNSNVINPVHVWLSFAVVLALSILLHHGVDAPAQRYIRRWTSRNTASGRYPSKG